MRQLPLKLTLSDDATFDNFYPGNNEFILNYLQNFATFPDLVVGQPDDQFAGVPAKGNSTFPDGGSQGGEERSDLPLHSEQLVLPMRRIETRKIFPLYPTGISEFVYLWGPAGTGRTHLLQACCQAMPATTAVFIDLAEPHLDIAILQELESCSLICLDNIDAVLRRCGWEIALFNLYNQSRDRGGKLLISALLPPTQLFCRLADLSSRFTAGLALGLQPLTDEQKLSALQMRAKHRGLDLSVDAGNFLLNHYPRNMRDLFFALETLDKEALSAKRRLTIPFVKQVLKL